MRDALRVFATDADRAGSYYSNLVGFAVAGMARAGLLPRQLAEQDQAYARLFNFSEGEQVAVLLTQVFFEMVALGYVVPKPGNAGGPEFNFIAITPAGREWAAGSEPIPEDSSGFLQALDALVPRLDPVIRQYVAEALVVYERRAFFAAAVMIGAASEATIYLLADALLAALTNATEKTNLERSIRRHEIAEILKRISGAIDRAKEPSGAMPYAVFEGADHYLLALQDSIRVQRNEAGHPTAGKVEPLAVRLALSAFPAACAKVYALAEWFRSNRV